MTSYFPDQGESVALQLLVNKIATPRDLILKLYTNDVSAACDFPEALDESDFTEATFSGYSAKTLTGASWTATPGDPSEVSYAQQEFEADSCICGSETIYGHYYVQATTGLLVRFFHYTTPITIENEGDAIRVTPVITGQGTED